MFEHCNILTSVNLNYHIKLNKQVFSKFPVIWMKIQYSLTISEHVIHFFYSISK